MSRKVKFAHVPDTEKHSFHFDYVRVFWNEQITSHQQNTWELSYIIKGCGTRIIGNNRGEFTKGQVVLIPPDIPHCFTFNEYAANDDGKIENITITFSTQFLRNLGEFFSELSEYTQAIENILDAVSYSNSTLEKLKQTMLAMINENKLNQLSSFIRLLGLIAFPDTVEIIGRPVLMDNDALKIQNIQLYIMNNYQHEIKLEDVANLVGLDRSAFCVFFKKMLGDTFVSYLTKYRIESSCHMMQKTKMTISEICFASGFNDVPYYNRVFKKLKGVSPKVWKALTLES